MLDAVLSRLCGCYRHRALRDVGGSCGIGLAGERRCPLGPSWQATSGAARRSSTGVPALRVQPAICDGPVGLLLPLPRHSGPGYAVCRRGGTMDEVLAPGFLSSAHASFVPDPLCALQRRC